MVRLMVGSPESAERFMSRVRVQADGCWVWEGARNSKGYGIVVRQGIRTQAHRLAWTEANGPVPPEMLVCHRCDNPPCVNVAHLFIGTPADNTQDMLRKGRQARGYRHKPGQRKLGGSGERHVRAKLTNSIVLDLRQRAAAGESQRAMARALGVSSTAVHQAVARMTWKHLA